MNRKRFNFDSIGEAFRAGNRARKKESVQDTVEQPYSPEKIIEDFQKITGYKLRYKDGWYEWSGEMRLEGGLFSDKFVTYNCKGLKTLPSPLRIGRSLHLKWCRDLETLPDTLEIGGLLDIEYCIRLRSIGEHTKVYTDIDVKGCGNLDRLPLGIRFGRTLHLNDMGAGIVEDTPVVTFVKSLGIDPGTWGTVYASQWPGNKRPVDEAFRAGNRARKKESAVDVVNETDPRFPGTGIDAFDDYFRTVYPTPESIQDSDFHTPENLRTFFHNAQNLLWKQYIIVKEDMNMDPCRLDLDWFRWFRGKLREFPQFIWPSHDNAAESVRSITIPEGTEVLVMRLGVFERLETVRLPDSLKKINVDAFSECYYLENVRFGGNLETIKTSAFYRCMSLGPIHIPASVRTIEFSAFEESGITEFVMDPDCQVEEIERNLCRLCKSLNRIELGNNVKWIKTLAFAFLGEVDEVILPAGLSQGVIEKNAFKNTQIKTVYIKGEDQYDNNRGLSGFESIRQKMLEAANGGEPEFISIP